MAALCQSEGRPDMYGLGIRLSFYVQWFGAALIQYMDETYLSDVRLLGLLLSAAAAVALVVQLTSDDHLGPVDIYLTLLLSLGVYLFLVPVYLWRALTCCNPYWNPARYARDEPSPAIKLSNFIIVVTLAAIGVWFTANYLPGLDSRCHYYGFFFSKVDVEKTAFIAFSAMFYLIIILVCAGIILVKSGCEMNIWAKERRRRAKQMHITVLNDFRFLSDIIAFAVLVAAVELTISWNHIKGVNNVNTSAQTIPLFLSIGFVVRTLFRRFAQGDDDDSDLDEVSTYVHYNTRRGSVFVQTLGTQPPPPPPAAHARR